ncbi:MAG: hypothetical protein H0U03_02755 [Actinobacteria bacterium]|nr:hypothetical protein [Actinomycetota bacterium]
MSDRRPIIRRGEAVGVANIIRRLGQLERQAADLGDELEVNEREYQTLRERLHEVVSERERLRRKLTLLHSEEQA